MIILTKESESMRRTSQGWQRLLDGGSGQGLINKEEKKSVSEIAFPSSSCQHPKDMNDKPFLW